MRIGGLDSQVKFAGAQDEFVGLDQINVSLSHALIGRGDVGVALTSDGQLANIIKIKIPIK
jgi:uncharacterized protein (TIGR03437 family)